MAWVDERVALNHSVRTKTHNARNSNVMDDAIARGLTGRQSGAPMRSTVVGVKPVETLACQGLISEACMYYVCRQGIARQRRQGCV